MNSLSQIFKSSQQWISNEILQQIAIAAFIIFIFLVISRLLGQILTRRISDNSVRYRAKKVTNFFLFIFSILGVLLIFSKQLGGLAITLGVTSAGIAFALQEVFASVAGWFAIHFSNFFTVGDRVVLGGIKGDVIDVGILRTTLMELGEWVDADQYNGRIVRVANSFVFKEPVFNYSADFPFVWDEIKIPIKYGSDYDQAKKIIEECSQAVLQDYEKTSIQTWNNLVKKYLVENANVEHQVFMTANENFITLSLRYVVDFKLRRSTKDHLFTDIIKKIEESQGQVKIACSTIEVSYSQPKPPR